MEALRFGIECGAPGQNVFVRGLTGTGRMTLVKRLLAELQPSCSSKRDRCYVHNFAAPDRPRLISLQPGHARAFRRRVQEMAEFIRDDLTGALGADPLKARREALERREKEAIEGLTEPFERDLKDAGLALVSVQMGPFAQTAIFPVLEGKPVPPEEFERLREQGRISEERHERFLESVESFQKRLEEVTEQIREVRRKHAQAVHSIVEETARTVLGDTARGILEDFPGEDVQRFLSEVVDDVAESRLGRDPAQAADPVKLYGVNVLIEHDPDDSCPIIIENTPTLGNLLGIVDREWGPQGALPTDYRSVRPGALLRADGGYLILDVRDVLLEPGAWRVLVRTLRTGRLEIVPSELLGTFWMQSIKPEPIPIQVRVILLGDSPLYYVLDRWDPDFSQLFKVLADFDSVIERDADGLQQYAGVLARIGRDEHLLPFHRTAVAALAEHGARVASQRGKLSSRFSRIADLAREAAFLAAKRNAKSVRGEDVERAVQRTKARGDLPSLRFREFLKSGTIRVQTRDSVVGQINGLAVIAAGPLVYGFPARITASIGAGHAGIIDIEGRASLSGAIHTKGFHILGGLFHHLLRTDHPLAFSASVAFEQSYGMIDGDSASAAEACCLLSALTAIAIRQDLALTGAIDQRGHVQAIGGVNEKIEGFFDTCADVGLTGTQGVIIPTANAGDLMLRPDVVDACAEGRFHVYAVETVQEALEILTGVPAGERDESGEYPPDTLLRKAVERAHEFWLKSTRGPPEAIEEEVEEAAEEEEGPTP
jgi:predicted ATP-dependent protease